MHRAVDAPLPAARETPRRRRHAALAVRAVELDGRAARRAAVPMRRPARRALARRGSPRRAAGRGAASSLRRERAASSSSMARRCAARRARPRRAARSNAPSNVRQSARPVEATAVAGGVLVAASSIASDAQSSAVTQAPRAAATSDGPPSPQPSSTTRAGRRVARAARAASASPDGQSSAQYGIELVVGDRLLSSRAVGSHGRSIRCVEHADSDAVLASVVRAARRARP